MFVACNMHQIEPILYLLNDIDSIKRSAGHIFSILCVCVQKFIGLIGSRKLHVCTSENVVSIPMICQMPRPSNQNGTNKHIFTVDKFNKEAAM